MEKTPRFTLTIGVIPGYFHENKPPHWKGEWGGHPEETPDITVARLWDHLIKSTMDDHGSVGYVSGVVTQGLAVYAREHGCPAAGELVVTISGVANPKFIPPGLVNEWKAAVAQLAGELATLLQQKTAYLMFDEVEFTYLQF